MDKSPGFKPRSKGALIYLGGKLQQNKIDNVFPP